MYRTVDDVMISEEKARWFYAKMKWALHWAVPTGEGYGYYHRKDATGKPVVVWRPFMYIWTDEDAPHPHDRCETIPVNDPLTFEEFITWAKWRIV